MKDISEFDFSKLMDMVSINVENLAQQKQLTIQTDYIGFPSADHNQKGNQGLSIEDFNLVVECDE